MPNLDPTLLHASDLPWRVHVAEEIGSTSDAARQAALAGEAPGWVLFAESQTAGRGRRDNRWITPKGQDLMFSLLLRPEAPAGLWPRMTTLAALAICLAIEEELPLRPQIKWPNDVYLGDRKVSGLLAEVVTAPSGLMLVLGIGLNVNAREFPPEISAVATSILKALPSPPVRPIDRHPLALALLRHLHQQMMRMEQGFDEAVAEVRARSWLLGRQIRATVDGVEVFGRVLDLDPEGHLRLGLPDGGQRILSSAESVRQVL